MRTRFAWSCAASEWAPDTLFPRLIVAGNSQADEFWNVQDGSPNRSGGDMLIVRSRNGVPVRLSDERWRHIVSRHPEVEGQRERVLEALAEPDIIQQGDLGELLAIRLYPDTPLTRKFMVVAYGEVSPEDGFILLTAYLASRPSGARETIWRR